MKKITTLSLAICLLFATAPIFGQIFVSNTATGSNNGSSWANAYTDLQAALNAAVNGNQIWIKAGTYIPSADTSGNTAPVNPRTKAYIIWNKKIKVYGGFAGNEFLLEQRNVNVNNNPVIISGDIGTLNTISDNCYTLLWQLGDSSLIDGIHFKDAYSNDDPSFSYVGAVTVRTPTTFDNCTFSNNSARRGGAICNENGKLTCRRTYFYNNQGSEQAGGIYASTSQGSLIEKCKFENNSSTYGGALKFSYGSVNNNHVVSNCIFINNYCSFNGAAIQCFSSRVEVENSTFYNNVAGQNGHTLSTYDAGLMRLSNCIMWRNNSTQNPIHVQSGSDLYVISNSIANTTITAMTAPVNMVYAAPQFVDTISFKLTGCSPAINAGSDALYTSSSPSDYNDLNRYNGIIDIGATEYSKPYVIEAPLGTLSADVPNAVNYQWINCSNNQAIVGQTTANFSPTTTGSYALVFTYGSCADTTTCYAFNFLGLNSIQANEIKVYPNPTKNQLTIELTKNSPIEIYSIGGQLMQRINDNNNLKISVEVMDYPAGLYLIRAGNSSYKFTKE